MNNSRMSDGRGGHTEKTPEVTPEVTPERMPEVTPIDQPSNENQGPLPGVGKK